MYRVLGAFVMTDSVHALTRSGDFQIAVWVGRRSGDRRSLLRGAPTYRPCSQAHLPSSSLVGEVEDFVKHIPPHSGGQKWWRNFLRCCYRKLETCATLLT